MKERKEKKTSELPLLAHSLLVLRRMWIFDILSCLFLTIANVSRDIKLILISLLYGICFAKSLLLNLTIFMSLDFSLFIVIIFPIAYWNCCIRWHDVSITSCVSIFYLILRCLNCRHLNYFDFQLKFKWFSLIRIQFTPQINLLKASSYFRQRDREWERWKEKKVK